MPDPFDALRQPIVPLRPEPAFAADLRLRIEAALGLTAATTTTGGTMSTTTSGAHVPTGLRALTPYLIARDAGRAIAFYEEVFGATVLYPPITGDDGRIGHAELRIEDSVIMIADEHPEVGAVSPESVGGSPVMLTLHVPDADATFERAVAAGATAERPVELQFYGARSGVIRDPFGHRWSLQTQVEPEPESLARGGADTPAATGAQGVSLGYFTVGVPDAVRARTFYGELFGWRFEGGSLDEGFHVPNIAPPGGLLGGQEEPTVTVSFRVDDIRATATSVRRLGGTAAEPTQYPSGWNASCTDDQGVAFDLWQPAPGY